MHAASVSQTATDSSSITVLAGAAAIAAGFGGVGVAVSVSVGLATNTIENQVLTGVNGSSTVVTAADFTSASGNTAVIPGDVVLVGPSYPTASYTAQGSGTQTVSMNPGTIVKLNPGYLTPKYLSSDSSTVTLNNGDRVAVSDTVVYAWEGGNGAQVKPSTANYSDMTQWVLVNGSTGAAYTFVGAPATNEDLNAQDYTNTALWEPVGGTPGTTYVYTGSPSTLNLGGQNYADTGEWQPVTFGGLSSSAGETATISATAFAAAVSLSVGAAAGISFSAAGANATNVILTETKATIDSSTVNVVGAISLSATGSSTITAEVKGLTAAAGGGGVGAALSVGSSTAQNLIGYLPGTMPTQSQTPNQVLAYINASHVTTSANTLTMQATANDTITATVDSLAAALAGGVVAISATGAGTNVVNDIANQIEAYIAGSSTVAAYSGASLSASDTSSITSSGAALAIAGSFGLFSGAVSIGVGLGSATVDDDVEAYVSGSTVSSAAGGLSLSATESDTVTTSSAAAAVTVTTGVGLSGGGATDTVTLESTVKAWVSAATLTLDGDAPGLSVGLSMIASDSSSGTAHVISASAALGSIGFAAAGSTATVLVDPTVEATIDNSTVTAQQGVYVVAGETSYADAPAEGNSVGTDIAAAGSTATATTSPTIEAHIEGGSVNTVGTGSATGQVTVMALYDETPNGTTYSTTTSPYGATSLAEASSGALLVGSSGANATASDNSSTKSFVTGAGLDVGGELSVIAGSDTAQSATAEGLDLGFAGIGVTLATATSDGVTSASLTGSGSETAIGGILVDSNATAAPTATSKALAGGVIAGAGTNATATVENDPGGDPFSSSSLTGNFSGGTITVSAEFDPNASATAEGGAFGAVSVGASVANAYDAGDVTASVADNAVLGGAAGLAVSATRTGGSMSSASAASGSLLVGVDATTSDATNILNGNPSYVTAKVGNDVTLPAGGVGVVANDSSSQNASSSGIAIGGLLGIGASPADASADIQTLAQLGYGEITGSTRAGALTIMSLGVDGVSASTTAGSGGVVSGDVSDATTDDSSDATTTLVAPPNNGAETLYAGQVVIDANHVSDYSTHADSENAGVVQMSGSFAHATSTADATTNIPGIEIDSFGPMSITAEDDFHRTDTSTAISAGGGGGISVTAATSHTTFTGTALVNIAAGANLRVDSVPLSSPSGLGVDSMEISASSVVTGDDVVSLSTGGAISGAGTETDFTANVTDTVDVGAGAQFFSTGDIGIGTWIDTTITAEADVHTWGIAAVGASNANATVNGTQTVDIGSGSALTAYGNLNLEAGGDPTGSNSTTITVNTSSQGYVRGLIAIPASEATSHANDTSLLQVESGTVLISGENSVLDGLPGTLDPIADGTGHGYELGFIPATQHSSTADQNGSGQVQMDGTDTAGYFNSVSLTIPDCGNTDPSDGDGAKFCSNYTLTVNGFSGAVTPEPALVASAFAATLPFTASQLQEIGAGSSSDPVYALLVSNLFASGGTVTVDATSLSGSTGSVTANGAPSITIQNDSPDYLVLGNMTIPNIPGGDVLFTGPAQTGLNFTANHAEGVGNINVTSDFDCSSFVGGDCVGNSTYGPAIMLSGEIDNLGGIVNITDDWGSFFQAGAILGQQVNLTDPHGAVILTLPSGDPYPAGSPNPYSLWENSMIWPGGDPGAATVCDKTGCHQTNNGSNPPNAAEALVWAINSYFNCGGCTNAQLDDYAYHWGSGTDPTLGGNDALDGNNYSDLFYGDCFPEEGTQGDSGGAGNCSQNGAKSDSLLNAYTQIDSDPEDPRAGGSARQGYLPQLPGSGSNSQYALSETLQSYPQAVLTNGSSAVYGNQVSITGGIIDLDTTITAGQPTSWSLLLPNTLTATIDEDQAAYNQYGGNADFPLDVDSEFGTAQVTAVYDAAIQQILVSEIGAAAGGSNVTLSGDIISSVPGSINVTGGLGQVNIDNETGVQMEIQRIFTGASNASVTNVIDVNDTLRNQQTVYVETPGAGTITYTGKVGDDIGCVEGTQTKNANGTTCGSHTASGPTSGAVTYSPQTGARWEWELEADLSRSVTSDPDGNYFDVDTTNWVFTNQPTSNDPWFYLSQGGSDVGANPTGWLQTGTGNENAFQQTITGSISFDFVEGVTYGGCDGTYGDGGCHYGFYDNVGEGSSGDGWGADWTYYYATNASITMVMSVKADNPITINFAGSQTASIVINSNAGVTLSDQITNPLGTLEINAQGPITATGQANIISNEVLLNTNGDGGIGTAASPLPITLTAVAGNSASGLLTAQASSAGVYLNLQGQAQLGSIVAQSGSSYGEIVVNSTGGISSAGNGGTVGATSPAAQFYLISFEYFTTDAEGHLNVNSLPFFIQEVTESPIAGFDTYNQISGRDITLIAGAGAGSSTAALRIAAHVDSQGNGGVVNVAAEDDVALEVVSGDLLIGRTVCSDVACNVAGVQPLQDPFGITSVGGDVTITVDDGGIYDASGQTAASAITDPQTIWTRLGLIAPGGPSNPDQSVPVEVFTSEVQQNYNRYWQLLLNGSVDQTGTQYSLDQGSYPLIQPLASAALGGITPTPQQIQDYAQYLWSADDRVLRQRLGAGERRVQHGRDPGAAEHRSVRLRGGLAHQSRVRTESAGRRRSDIHVLLHDLGGLQPDRLGADRKRVLDARRAPVRGRRDRDELGHGRHRGDSGHHRPQRHADGERPDRPPGRADPGVGVRALPGPDLLGYADHELRHVRPAGGAAARDCAGRHHDQRHLGQLPGRRVHRSGLQPASRGRRAGDAERRGDRAAVLQRARHAHDHDPGRPVRAEHQPVGHGRHDQRRARQPVGAREHLRRLKLERDQLHRRHVPDGHRRHRRGRQRDERRDHPARRQHRRHARVGALGRQPRARAGQRQPHVRDRLDLRYGQHPAGSPQRRPRAAARRLRPDDLELHRDRRQRHRPTGSDGRGRQREHAARPRHRQRRPDRARAGRHLRHDGRQRQRRVAERARRADHAVGGRRGHHAGRHQPGEDHLERARQSVRLRRDLPGGERRHHRQHRLRDAADIERCHRLCGFGPRRTERRARSRDPDRQLGHL